MMSLEIARYRDWVWVQKVPNVLHHGAHCYPPSHSTCIVLVLVLVSHGAIPASSLPETRARTRIRSRRYIPLHFMKYARSTRLFYSPCKAKDDGLGICLAGGGCIIGIGSNPRDLNTQQIQQIEGPVFLVTPFSPVLEEMV